MAGFRRGRRHRVGRRQLHDRHGRAVRESLHGDLHLRPTATVLLNQVTSPIAAAGVDWDGDARPMGATDLGADELTTAETALAAPTGLHIVK